MIRPIKSVAKNICNAPWRVQGTTYLSCWPYRSRELASEEKVIDSLIMVTKHTLFTTLLIPLYNIVLS
jgi:hypothetical protein